MDSLTCYKLIDLYALTFFISFLKSSAKACLLQAFAVLVPQTSKSIPFLEIHLCSAS